MEKPPKLKVETEVVVGESNAQAALIPLETEQAIAEKLPRNLPAEREAKKLADQEFMAAYEKRERFLRLRFAIMGGIFLGVFLF